MDKLFGTDGIRGVVGTELTDDLAYNIGSSLVSVLLKQGVTNPKIIIGMDTRESSLNLCVALCDGIRAAGGFFSNIGVCSTPAIAYLVVSRNFDAGVMISASHNPYQYNGIKIFGRDGCKLSDEMEEEIERNILTPNMARKEYIEYLKNCFGQSFFGIRLGIDCANGSTYVSAKELFSSLGAECYFISDLPNGKNINENCGSTHLNNLKNLVISNNLDLGIAFDGDGDRCIAIDEKGRVVDGDHIMAILTLRLKNDGMLSENTVVGTVMTNLGFVDFCKKNGIEFRSTNVGDRFVLQSLNEGGFSLGGEQSGHIILREKATTGDGQLTALALLSEIKKSGKRLSTLAEIISKYPQITINIKAEQIDKENLYSDDIREIIRKAEKELGDTGRIIIRPSGTEPLIRIMVECESSTKAQAICQDVADSIKKTLDKLNSAMR